MNTRKGVVAAILALAISRPGPAIQTEKVELGVNGSYDGTVWVTRDSSGSIVFLDQTVGSSVTLQDLVAGSNDHGSLTGLADDDHAQYHTGPRHQGAHTASFDNGLPISGDVGTNTTLGGHLSDGNIHIQKDAAEIVSGAWRFTGTPVFASRLRLEIVPPETEAAIEFGPSVYSPRFSYVESSDAFEFTRRIQATSATLTNVQSTWARVYTNLDGRNEAGQPAATLTNFASINGIGAANLLDAGANEDIEGQWDFLSAVRMFDDLSVENVTANGVVEALGVTLTTGTETGESSGMFSHLETTSDSLKVVLDRSNNQPGYKRLQVYAGDHPAVPVWELANDGDNVVFSAYTNSGVPRLQIGGDGTSCYVRRALTGARYYLYENGNIVNILPSTDGSDSYKVQDSGYNDVFAVDSDGNVTMAADAKMKTPDGADGPFVESWHAPALLETALTADAQLTTAGVWTTAAAGTLYFDWPVGCDVLGGNVVVDRCTVYCDAVDAQDYIDRIRLVAFDRAGGPSTAILHTADINSGASHQWIDSDYTMADDRSYLLAVDLVHGNDGAWIRSFKVEYHLE